MLTSFRTKIAELFCFDLRSLATFRITLGLLILLDLLLRSRDITAFYTDQGVLPRYALWGESFLYGLSVHLISGTWFFQIFLFLLAGVFAILLIFGYRTWLTTLISWLLLISIQNRNPFINSGGDQLFALLLFWSLFLPLGAKYSWDSLKRTIPLPKTIANSATLAYALQIVFVYFFTVLHKSGAPWRTEGTAVFYALNQSNFSTPVGMWLLNFPELLKISTFGVYAFEIIGPFLLFFPYKTGIVRTIAVFLFIFMHTMFGLGLDLGIFSFVVAIAFIPLIPTFFWDKVFLALRSKERTKLIIYYDYECSFCKFVSLAIKTFFLLPETKILSAQNYPDIQKAMNDNDSWVVKDSSGKTYYSFKAFSPIFKASPLLWPFEPLLRFPFVQKIGALLYKKVSLRRKTIFCEIPTLNPKTSTVTNLKLNRKTSIAIISLVIFVFYWNLSTFQQLNFIMIPKLEEFGIALRLDQKWTLFAPAPGPNNIWYTLVGEFEDGHRINLLKPDQPISFQRPSLGKIPYKNTRWMKFMISLLGNRNRNFISYSNFLCKQWNTGNQSSRTLKLIELNKLTQEIPLSGSPKPPEIFTFPYTCRKT